MRQKAEAGQDPGQLYSSSSCPGIQHGRKASIRV